MLRRSGWFGVQFHIFLIQHHFKVTSNTWKHGVSHFYEWHSGSRSLMLYSSSFSFHFYVEKLFWSEIDLSFSSSSAASQTASIHHCAQPSAQSGWRADIRAVLFKSSSLCCTGVWALPPVVHITPESPCERILSFAGKLLNCVQMGENWLWFLWNNNWFNQFC